MIVQAEAAVTTYLCIDGQNTPVRACLTNAALSHQPARTANTTASMIPRSPARTQRKLSASVSPEVTKTRIPLPSPQRAQPPLARTPARTVAGAAQPLVANARLEHSVREDIRGMLRQLQATLDASVFDNSNPDDLTEVKAALDWVWTMLRASAVGAAELGPADIHIGRTRKKRGMEKSLRAKVAQADKREASLSLERAGGASASLCRGSKRRAGPLQV